MTLFFWLSLEPLSGYDPAGYLGDICSEGGIAERPSFLKRRAWRLKASAYASTLGGDHLLVHILVYGALGMEPAPFHHPRRQAEDHRCLAARASEQGLRHRPRLPVVLAGSEVQGPLARPDGGYERRLRGGLGGRERHHGASVPCFRHPVGGPLLERGRAGARRARASGEAPSYMLVPRRPAHAWHAGFSTSYSATS